MPFINEISKCAPSSEQKLTAQEISNFSPKAMLNAHVVGRKGSCNIGSVRSIC